jgi:hypothetical protein
VAFRSESGLAWKSAIALCRIASIRSAEQDSNPAEALGALADCNGRLRNAYSDIHTHKYCEARL